MKYLEVAELDRVAEALNVKTSEWKLEAKIECYTLKFLSKEKKLYKDLEDKYLSVVRQVLREANEATSGTAGQAGEKFAAAERQETLVDQLGSPFGPLNDPEARKTLFLLITILNATFSDHDFTNVSPDDFRAEEDPQTVIENVNTTLSNLGLSTFAATVRSPALRAQSSPNTASSSLPEESSLKRDRRASNKDPKNRTKLSSSQQSSSITTAFGSPNGLRDMPASKHERRSMLWEVVNSVIGLDDCEVYSYNPDTEADPHASYTWDEISTEPDDEVFQGANSTSSRSNRYQTRSRTRRKRGGPFGLGGAVDSPVRSRILSGYPSQSGSRETSMAPTDISTDTGDLSAEDIFPFGEIEESSVGDEDDHGGLIWSETYFFLNRKARKILLFTLWSVSPRPRGPAAAAHATSRVVRVRSSNPKVNQAFSYDPFSQSNTIAVDDDPEDGMQI